MRDYLKIFQNHEDYEDYVDSEEYITPSICVCETENEVHYNKLIQPLTFIAEEDGCVICMVYYSYNDGFDYLCDFEYSLNGGEWTEYQKSMDDYSGGTTYGLDFELDEGESVSIRRCGDMENDFKNYTVSISGYVGAYGDITSLVNGVGGDCDLTYKGFSEFFKGQTGLTHAPNLPSTTVGNECYMGMFAYCTALTKGPSILPATSLTSFCYYSMFEGCTSLTTAPELPATTLVSWCYDYMFAYCTNLNYIKAMFLTTPSTTYTKNWVSGVKSTGTFVKNSSANWNVTGVHGIPTNWTVQTASS